MQPRRRQPAGFTLVEILAVMAILGLLVGLSLPMINKARANASSKACKSNLQQIAMSLQNYVDTRKGGRWPKLSGVQFLLVLHREGEIEGKSLEIFLCPGTDDTTRLNESDREYGTGYEDWENIDTRCISYAGRDNVNFPLNKNKLDLEIIAADDNELRPNHEHITNFVYADSRTDQADIADYRDELPEGAECVPVGPDSPHEGLAKLLIDF